ncbi:MAG: hemerythrin domain-containing protein [Ezakiella sp.]|nr:hemerythrin domain-containing protein [Ezakiella sp.]
MDNYSIKVLLEEHENIKTLLGKMVDIAQKLMNKEDVDLSKIEMTIDIIKNYADFLHHKKEEEILFKSMIDNLGDVADKLITHGMLVEHSLARYEVLSINNSLLQFKNNSDDHNRLRLIEHIMAYVDLLYRHIEKENNVVYIFAKNNLDQNELDRLGKLTLDFEKEHELIRDEYIEKLNEL